MPSIFEVTRLFAVITTLLGICAVAPPISAQETEEGYYNGKTVHLIVGTGVGGGYDTYARMIAPRLAQALGPNTTVIVQNQVGAGGIVALNGTFAAPPDGLRLMIANGSGAVLSQIVGSQGVRYDVGAFGYLGTVHSSSRMWLVSPNSPIKTPQDAINSPNRMMWAAGGPIDGASDGAAFMCAALTLNCKITIGYKGGADLALALGRGEADGLYISDTSALAFVNAGNVRPIATISYTRSSLFPDIPTIFESVKLAPDKEWLLDYRATVDALGRILIVPPNLPSARLAYMQAAVKKALSDPALIAEGERNKHYIGYINAEKTRAAALKVYQMIAPEQRDRIKAIVSTKE